MKTSWKGEYTVVTKYKYVNGRLESRVLVKAEITKQPVNKIIERGAMVPIEVSQGYLGTELETVLVRLGQSPVLKTPTREGYTFAGWYVDGDEFDTNTIISEDDYGLYVYAEWEENVKPDEPEVPEQPQQNKYTLRVKEVDAEGNSIAFLEVFEDLTVEELNAKTDAYKETPEQPNVPGETDKETPKEPKVPS